MSDLPKAFAAYFDADVLAADPSTLVAVDPRGTILWVNPAWRAFARANDGAQVLERFDIGDNYFEGIAPPLRSYFEHAFGQAWSNEEVFEQEYECSTPGLRREMRLRALPVANGGLLLEHTLVFQASNVATPFAAQEARYRNADGLIVQCSNCRRICRTDRSAWDWVPQWVASPPSGLSHGLCELCVAFYWGRRLRRS